MAFSGPHRVGRATRDRVVRPCSTDTVGSRTRRTCSWAARLLPAGTSADDTGVRRRMTSDDATGRRHGADRRRLTRRTCSSADRVRHAGSLSHRPHRASRRRAFAAHDRATRDGTGRPSLGGKHRTPADDAVTGTCASGHIRNAADGRRGSGAALDDWSHGNPSHARYTPLRNHGPATGHQRHRTDLRRCGSPRAGVSRPTGNIHRGLLRHGADRIDGGTYGRQVFTGNVRQGGVSTGGTTRRRNPGGPAFP